MPEQLQTTARIRAERPEVVLARRTRAAIRPAQKLVSELNERLAHLQARQLHSQLRRDQLDIGGDVDQLRARLEEAGRLLEDSAFRLGPDEVASSYFKDVELAIAALNAKLARLAEPQRA